MRTTFLRLCRGASPAVATAAAAAATAAGLVYLGGWWFDVPALSGAVAGLPPVRPTTALGLSLAGAALTVLRHGRATAGRRRLATALAAGTCLIGLLALATALTHRAWVPHPPAVYTALMLALLGASLLLLDARPRRGPQPAQLLALFALHVALLALLGQAFGNPALYALAQVDDAGVSLPTSLLAAGLAAGVLCARPDAGFTAILLGGGGGGVVARRLLLAPIALPLLVGLVVWGVRRAGIVGQDFGGWLFTTAYFTAFTLIIWWVASVVRRADDTIRRLNEGLERRVAERTADLTEANRQLEHRNRENETFVYSVSHDLRSPLVNLQGFAKELDLTGRDVRGLLDDDRLPADVRGRGRALIDGDMAESIRFIRTAVMRLSGIIDALLRLSRAGRVQYAMQPVDVAATVGRIVDALHGTVRDRGARVAVGALPAAWGDPTAVEQVFANLIGNALNYLDPGRPGVVEVGNGGSAAAGGGRNKSGWHEYYIRDNGLGIPEAHRGKVFQAFQRLHPEAAPGEGMGLAIVHRIVERHGGRVWLESAPGVGTTFFVRLPAAPDGEPAAGPPD